MARYLHPCKYNKYVDITCFIWYCVAMYIDVVPNRNSKPAILIRRAWREGKKTHKETIANISHWPMEQVLALKAILKGDKMVPADKAIITESSLPHGHVQAVLGTIKKIEIDKIIAPKRSKPRDLALAMIAEHILHPCSKLATTRMWRNTTLAEELDLGNADEDDLYDAMDWLLELQPKIEKRLAARYLSNGQHALYDVSSSFYEGRTCPLARFGHSRDGKKGKPIIVYGVMTDAQGRPVSVQVYRGNTGDPSTVPDQAEKLKKRFGLRQVVLVGDRGMLTTTQIDKLGEYPGLGWISALRSTSLRKLVETGRLQLSFFDQKNLAEIESPDFPGERLVACYNPLLSEQRRKKREELLKATQEELEKIVRETQRRTKKPLTKTEIAQKVGRKINRYNMAKHFKVDIREGEFSFQQNETSIRREADLDGIYIIRTSEPKERLSAEDAVRGYKNLARVERLFRTVKGIDLKVRPIRHREERRVRAHIFICMLAYLVEWHMRKALAPVIFDDEQLDEDRLTRDPVAPAKPSASARQKKTKRLTHDGIEIQSFETLILNLATLAKIRCRVDTPNGPSQFHQFTEKTPLQNRAFSLLGL